MLRRPALLLLAVLVAAPLAAGADDWRPVAERQRALASLADRVGLPRASQRAVDALNRAYGCTLTPDRVRICSYAGGRRFWSFVDVAKQSALGMAVTPHGSGPHPHLLVGDFVYDGIQPGWTNNGVPAKFSDGTMMRKDTFGREHGGAQRIFCVWQAPQSALAHVGAEAERLHRERRQVGYNCAALVSERLAGEAAARVAGAGTPFAWLRGTWSPRGAVEGVLRANPDIVIQVMPEHDLQRALRDPGHLIRFWHEQDLR
jgi:hypothetical protein